VLVPDIGASGIATGFLQHNPPAPIEIEDAIMVVEDEVTRARGLAVGGPSLHRSLQRRRVPMFAGARTVRSLALHDGATIGSWRVGLSRLIPISVTLNSACPRQFLALTEVRHAKVSQSSALRYPRQW